MTTRRCQRTGEDRPDALSGFDELQMCVVGNEERVLLTALYDNLGKGASRAALQCLNLDDGSPRIPD